jgi:hypothetical protein
MKLARRSQYLSIESLNALSKVKKYSGRLVSVKRFSIFYVYEAQPNADYRKGKWECELFSPFTGE